MDYNNIQFINQRLAYHRSLIPQCKAQSAAEKRLADTIITLEIKRIEAIHALEIRLGELLALIPVYKARCPTYEHVLAKQIINLDLQLIAANTKQFPTQPSAPHLFSLHPPAPHLPEPHSVILTDLVGILTEHYRQIPNLYWQPGQPIGAPVSNF